MRAVPLKNVVSEFLNLIISPEEFSILHGKDERERFKQMWTEQGEGFWLKFVTAVRNKILLKPHDYIAVDCDPVFIEILKKLSGKSCGAIMDHISHTELIVQKRVNSSSIDLMTFINGDQSGNSKLANAVRATLGKTQGLSQEQLRQRFRVNLNCVGVLLRVLDLWRQSSEGESVLELPAPWALRCTVAQPYEVYLRARWGDRLPELLGFQKSQLGWWNAPALPPPPPLPQIKKDGPNWLQETFSWAAKHPRIQLIAGKNTFYKRVFKSNGNDLKWRMLELSIAPPLAAKFHRSAASELLKVDKHYMAVCVWTASCQQGLGSGLSFLQQSQHYELGHFDPLVISASALLEWKKKMEKMLKVLQQTFEEINGSPKPEDLAQDAVEILLDPRVLLNLPSSPSLLQTWLACAIIEINKIEYESLELRHWPLKPELEIVARELLALIAYTKERVLLAMSLFVMHVVNYVEVMYDAKLLLVLLEKALLPSTTGLQFICSGKASKAIAQIKQLAWFEPSNISDCVSVPLDSYNPAEILADVHINFFWHFKYWCHPEYLLEPFPAVILMNTDVQGLVSELRRNIVPPAKNPATYSVNQLGHEEYAFWAEWFNKHQGGDYQDMSTNVDKRLTQIKKVVMHVATLEYVTQDMANKLMDAITEKTIHEVADFGFDMSKNITMSLPQQAVLYASMYIQFNETMRGIEEAQKSSVLNWLVRVSGELTEREQLVRLAAVIGQYSEVTPKLPYLLEAPKDITADKILQEVKAVSGDPVRGLDWLWSQLPSAWQLYVNTSEKEPQMEKGLAEVVKTLENRVGRLLLTSAREGLRKSDVFDQRLEIQYLMPCYISALLEVGSQSGHLVQAQNLTTLLHCLLTNYETQLDAWTKGDRKHSSIFRDLNHMKNAYDIIIDTNYKFNNTVFTGQHVLELITQRMQAFIGLGQRDLEGLPGFCEVASAFKQWPVIVSCTEILNERYSEVEVFSCFAWKNFSLPHILTLHQQCQIAWPIEPPKDPKLAQLLYTTELMSHIEVLSCAAFHRDYLLQFQLQVGSADFHELLDKMNHVLVWRREFLARVVSAEMQKKEDLDRCVAKGQSLTKDMWRAARALRRRTKTVYAIDFPPTGHPTLEQAVAHFVSGNIKETDDAINHPDHYLAKEAKAQSAKPTSAESKPQRKVSVPKPSASTSQVKTMRPGASSFDPSEIWCRKCYEVQRVPKSYIKCQQCVTKKYPDVNYFCSKKCEETWMKEEHFAEHLEYELGLSPLCQKK